MVLDRLGALISGAARAAALSPKKCSAIAAKAAKSRRPLVRRGPGRQGKPRVHRARAPWSKAAIDLKRTCVAFLVCAAAVTASPAQTLTTLVDFWPGLATSQASGDYPGTALVQGVDGNLYGTKSESGGIIAASPNTGSGTLFKVTPGGALTALHTFAGSDGARPVAALIQATDGNFYGTTYAGGPIRAL